MRKDKKNTSMETAYQAILERIMHEQFEPGMPLREDHLASELGISTTPIREAFRRLEHEGWLQSRPFRGVFLRKFTRQDICELYYLRSALEGAAAEAAAKNATTEDFEKLHDALEAEKVYVRENIQAAPDSIKPNIEGDLIFHAAIADAAHNQLLEQRLQMLKAQTSYAFLNWRNTVGDSKIERTKSLLCEIFKHKTFFCSQRENGYSVNYCVQNRWRSIGKNFITTVDEKSFFDGEIPE